MNPSSYALQITGKWIFNCDSFHEINISPLLPLNLLSLNTQNKLQFNIKKEKKKTPAANDVNGAYDGTKHKKQFRENKEINQNTI